MIVGDPWAGLENSSTDLSRCFMDIPPSSLTKLKPRALCKTKHVHPLNQCKVDTFFVVGKIQVSYASRDRYKVLLHVSTSYVDLKMNQNLT